jgi:hypothetical protein
MISSLKKISIIFICSLFITKSMAQGKDIGNEEINITKERQIELPKANRIFDKIPATKSEKVEKKMDYAFFDRKPTAIEEIKFNPNVVNPIVKKANEDEIVGFKNNIKFGIGNFGRIYGEAYINSDQNQKLVYGITALHNSTKRGPVGDKNSAASINKIGIDGKYHQNNYELKMNVGYERRNYHFYGYDTTSFNEFVPADIRQRINMYNVSVGFENTNPKPKVDYSLTTSLKSLNDNYNASEVDWGTHFKSYFPLIKDKLVAVLDAEAFLTQRSDNYDDPVPVRKRNLYRVEPSFRFDFGRFTTKFGFKAVNEFDQIQKINTTKGFPTVSVAYKTPSLIYFFAGFDGDIIRNTLHSMLNENPYLVEQVNLLNTNKNQDFYIGSRGDLFSGITYNLKMSYGQYQNLYYFNKYDGITYTPNGQPVNTTKYQVDYDENKTKFINVSTEFGYSNFEYWKSNIKIDYDYFEAKKFAKPFHRPSFTGTWANTFTLTNKLVANLDFYFINGIYANDIDKTEPVKLKPIADLNAEFTYLFTKRFSAFVKLNNIIGQNYERYYNYRQLGLNFVAGINVAL